VALEQTRGRGRLDHPWSSPPGGVYLSILLAPPPEHEALLPLALGARLAHELEDRYAQPFRVKGPNDVLVAGDPAGARKVAGILVDRVIAPGGGAVAVAGIGVNVTTTADAFPTEVRARATSLSRVASRSPSLDEVEELVVRSAMRAAIGLRGPGGPEATRALCRRWLWGVGRRATVDGALRGTIVGIGDEGELLLEPAEGERVAIRAGDVRMEGTA
jgi:BirA family transcriptional regulator, biotin operon repressor / biotin---[acetyl-CoA-carboxylase] ligase